MIKFTMGVNRLNYFFSKNTLIALFVLHPLFSLFWYKGYFLLTLFGLTLVLGVEFIAKRGRVWFDSRPLAAYLFFSLPLISVLWSRYPAETFWQGSLVLVNIGIFHLMMRANTFRLDKVISTIVMLVPVVMAIIFLILYVKYGSIRADSREMADVVKSIANVGPALVVLCVPYLLLVPGIVGRKINLCIALAACLFVVLLSQSRGGMLMLAIVVPLSFCLYPARWSIRVVRLLKVAMIVTAIAVIAVLFLGVERISTPVVERFENSQLTSIDGIIDPSRGSGDFRRALIYAEGINAVYDEPFLGIGYGGLARYMEARHGIGSTSHNIIITAWGEMGLPGMLVLFWLLWSVFFGLRKYLRSSGGSKKDKLIAAATLAALIVAFIHAQFRPLFSNPMLPVLLAQAYTMMRLTRKHSNASACACGMVS